MNALRIAEINAELVKLQQKYDKKLGQPDGCRPPAIKADLLARIAKEMDRLDGELATLQEVA